MQVPPASSPIVCDMSAARDTAQQRLEEYRRLFAQALLDRDRVSGGIRFRFRATTGIETWVRDLAAREKACCAFSAHEVTAVADEVHWDVAVTDNEIARDILEEFYALPETMHDDLQAHRTRLTEQGLAIRKEPALGGTHSDAAR
jgi:hypothetical protein